MGFEMTGASHSYKTYRQWNWSVHTTKNEGGTFVSKLGW